MGLYEIKNKINKKNKKINKNCMVKINILNKILRLI